MPAREVTVSAIESAPCSLAIWHKVSASDRTPVDVSACTKARILASGWLEKAACTFSGSTGWPQASSTITGTPPHRRTFSSIRPPKTPLRQTMTFSPGSTRLTNAVSMPAEPGAETTMLSRLVVWNAYWVNSFTSSIIRTNSGSKCPIVGRERAAITLG